MLAGMDEQLRRKIEANIYPPSHQAVEPWDKFPWHLDSHKQCDAWKMHSSQALAIDVFGLLKVTDQSTRDAILGTLAKRLGLPSDGPWTMELEWTDPDNRLREKRRTQVDAIARSLSAVILFECKFTEPDGGACSQTKRRSRGTQCNGNYGLQVNPINQIKARCALTGKGIRYWEAIPRVFDYDANADYRPCPFRGPWYQWMRNLVLCSQLARLAEKPLAPAFVLVYAEAQSLSVAQLIRSSQWFDFTRTLKSEAITFVTLPCQDLLSSASDSPPYTDMGAYEFMAIPGDYDGNERLDGDDFTAFVSCGSGAAVPYTGDCTRADLDHDSDVDSDDFAVMQRCLEPNKDAPVERQEQNGKHKTKCGQANSCGHFKRPHGIDPATPQAPCLSGPE